jgi:hypothetical protein
VSPHTRYVAGIDQFCDRWCAKCPMTARCEAFARTRRDAALDPPPDADEARVLKYLRALVGVAAQALHTLPAGEGSVDAPATSGPEPPRTAQPVATGSSTPPPPANEPLVLGVLAYMHAVRGWFDEERTWLQEKRRAFRTLAAVSADPAGVLCEAEALVDALETVAWDVALIPERVEVALAAAPTNRTLADGHAKVALLSFDRSIEAWLTVRRGRRVGPDTVVPILHHLADLRRQFEGAFPRARRFVRPGFDAQRPDVAPAAPAAAPGARP